MLCQWSQCTKINSKHCTIFTQKQCAKLLTNNVQCDII
nr:MAG TPA: hypothetical protein [Caudoviricetes sp.]